MKELPNFFSCRGRGGRQFKPDYPQESDYQTTRAIGRIQVEEKTYLGQGYGKRNCDILVDPDEILEFAKAAYKTGQSIRFEVDLTNGCATGYDVTLSLPCQAFDKQSEPELDVDAWIYALEGYALECDAYAKAYKLAKDSNKDARRDALTELMNKIPE